MYKKTTWKNQIVERPRTFELSLNEDKSYTLIDSFGEVTQLGTPVDEENMNKIEDGIAACAIRKYDTEEEFALGEWVLGDIDDKKSIYESLVDKNLNNPLSDSDFWMKVGIDNAGLEEVINALDGKLDKDAVDKYVKTSSHSGKTGYLLYDDNFCIQWGTASSGTNGYGAFWLPVLLQEGQYISYATVFGTSANGNYSVRVQESDDNAVAFRIYNGGSAAANVGAYFLAIGIAK